MTQIGIRAWRVYMSGDKMQTGDKMLTGDKMQTVKEIHLNITDSWVCVCVSWTSKHFPSGPYGIIGIAQLLETFIYLLRWTVEKYLYFKLLYYKECSVYILNFFWFPYKNENHKLVSVWKLKIFMNKVNEWNL